MTRELSGLSLHSIGTLMPAFTSNTAHLPGGVDIFYTDSGAPPNSVNYTTVLILHGSAFAGQGFEKLHDFAHSFNLRIVIWNRRDYPGSTRYTDSELDDLHNGRKVFLDRLAIQLGQFLKQFVEEEAIPSISVDRKSGGFAIMGWSMGAATALTLFADHNLIPYTFLEPYVKDLILYDPPYLTFGFPLPADADKSIIYDPWANPDNRPAEELYRNFRGWVSSYYDQPDQPSSINELNFARRTDHATIDSWDAKEMERQYCETAAVRSELYMYIQPMQQTLNDLTNCVLFDEELTQAIFPKVPVTYIITSKSNWQCFWGGIESERNYRERMARGAKIRSTIFITIEGGNHFVHWDMPEELMKHVVAGIRGSVLGIRS